ncbi:Cellulose synthase-like D3 [Tripterygium wilfordii]|uniref:Cellulose synthase-like D3 n=1 Tax=Tripterygium wilfordii TaxID=458696 RepID=A0A7J7C7J6_TRIWF|nr:cellulose synthase-like protein D2 [Tripterygium wilfordii]XP_038687968.1 cellulose synthase-like protein D2 [Tripterygium wilfordii]KAF5729736.1 Cellulose synthase-like D3 [Tripterygium wilfordii]
MASDYQHARIRQQFHNYSGYTFDIDNVEGDVEFSTYTVQAPPTPDNQPLEIFVDDKTGSNSMFSGHHERLTQANSKKSGNSAKGSWSDEGDFNFYRDGYREADETGDGVVTGQDLPDTRNPFSGLQGALSSAKSLPSSEDRNVSVNRHIDGFDDCEWMFESKRSYGYGSALHNEDAGSGYSDSIGGDTKAFIDKRWRPLARVVKISTAILCPYRLLIFVRMVALVSFMLWRVLHPNEDAYWLWGMSVACEIWFSFSWILEQLPKLCPINRDTDLDVLKEKFESPSPSNPTGKSDLPGIDIFVSSVDTEIEPPLVTANTVLSILAADYPVEKLSCYVSDDSGALLTFEAMAETASFAGIWVPFCRKHDIEPRNPESYFKLKIDPYKDKVRPDFVRDRRKVKREYDEFKVRINGLFDSIRRRSDTYNTREEVGILKQWREKNDDEPIESLKIPKATWMADGTYWPGTWAVPDPEHSRGEHASIIQVMLNRPADEPVRGAAGDASFLDLTKVDIRLPMLVYVSREKRTGYDHNKKAGALNALLRASAIMSNGAFVLNLDGSNYIYNSQALREGMCFMMDHEGDRICYVQFPLRFEGIDPSDRNANSNTVFFDINMRALDGVQGPMYVGTGCLFRRTALYGFDPPRLTEPADRSCCCFRRRRKVATIASDSESSQGVAPEDARSLRRWETDDEEMNIPLIIKKFGNSSLFSNSIGVAAYEGLPIADPPSAKNGRPPGALTTSRGPLDASTVAEAIDAISCWYEDKTEWGQNVGWIYGSTEDLITGYRMQKRGWKSVYCVTKIDAFRGTALINLTDRLHQFLDSATGSVEIFFSRNNALLGGSKLKLLQRIAYLNGGLSPITSIFLTVYCFIPAISLFTNQFIVESLDITFLTHLLVITLTLSIIATLEIKWSGIALEEWWRNEQFWLIKGTSSHLAAVLHGLLNVFGGIELSSTSTAKSAGDGDDDDDEFADLYTIKWTFLMLPPIIIIIVNLIALAVAVFRTMYSTNPKWSQFLGGAGFCIWVLVHLFPFVKGLTGKRGKTPTVVYVWAGLISISISLLWVAIKPPSGNSDIVGSFQFL